LHCGNNLPGTQYGSVSPQLQFMHLMPYIDSLWFGEGYDYQSSKPPYWLVEISGVPFGLMGDMMHEGHVWRGMLYGMTTRFRCADPTPMWRLWDKFGMTQATMFGYWHPQAPVTSSCPDVLVTSYVRHGNSTMLAVASWDIEKRTCALKIDYAAIGLEPEHARVHAPDLSAFGQPGPFEIELHPSDGYAPVVAFDAGHGAVLIVERRA